MAQLPLQCLSQVCAAPQLLQQLQQLHPGSVALVPPFLLELWLFQKPLMPLPEQSHAVGAETERAGQRVTGSLLLLMLTIGAFFPSRFLDHCTE